MNGKIFQFVYLITFVLMSGVVSAQNYVIQKDHSQIFFSLSYLRFGEVQGQIQSFGGKLVLGDSEEMKELIVHLNINSIDTGHKLRDGHLKAQDFFYVQKYPESVFRYVRTLSRQKSRYVIEGLLTIKEITRPLTLTVELNQEEQDSWGYQSRFAKFSAQLNRLNFGLNWNKTLKGEKFLVGEEVKLFGVVQLQRQQALTPTSKHMIPDTPIMRNREKAQRGEERAQSTLDLNQASTPMDTNEIKPDPIHEIVPKLKMNQPSTPVSQNPWFWLLGLMGFFSSLILGLFAKKWLIEHDPKYEEDSTKGYLSDIFTIGFTLLYAVAFWFVGWGS